MSGKRLNSDMNKFIEMAKNREYHSTSELRKNAKDAFKESGIKFRRAKGIADRKAAASDSAKRVSDAALSAARAAADAYQADGCRGCVASVKYWDDERDMHIKQYEELTNES